MRPIEPIANHSEGWFIAIEIARSGFYSMEGSRLALYPGALG